MSDIPERTRLLIRAREDDRCAICRAPMTDIHHRLRKGMGGTSSVTIHDASNLIGMCRWHHGWTHAHVTASVLGGWIVPTDLHPGMVPIWMQNPNYGYPGWFYLDDDACVRWAGEANEPLILPPGLPSLAVA